MQEHTAFGVCAFQVSLFKDGVRACKPRKLPETWQVIFHTPIGEGYVSMKI